MEKSLRRTMGIASFTMLLVTFALSLVVNIMGIVDSLKVEGDKRIVTLVICIVGAVVAIAILLLSATALLDVNKGKYNKGANKAIIAILIFAFLNHVSIGLMYNMYPKAMYDAEAAKVASWLLSSTSLLFAIALFMNPDELKLVKKIMFFVGVGITYVANFYILGVVGGGTQNVILLLCFIATLVVSIIYLASFDRIPKVKVQKVKEKQKVVDKVDAQEMELKEKLKKLQQLYDEKLLTKEEFEEKRKKVIEEL